MTINITMPALSPTMTEGTLAKWLKAEGDSIEAGEPIAEIETDKATMEVEAVEDGVLGKIVVSEGVENVAVNTIIGVMLAEGEDSSALEGVSLEAPAPAPAPPAPAEEAAPAAVEPVAPTATAPPAARDGERIKASPLARKMAAQAGIDLGTLTGSGPKGRIVKADIEAAVGGAPAAAAAPATPAGAAPEGNYTEVPLSNMRKTIARRLTESKQTIPHYYLSVDCELDRLLALRKELNARDEGFKISVNDFVVRAVGLALRKVPEANAGWSESAIHQYDTVDVSVAVAIPDGLITPIVRDADRKGLASISAEVKDLAARARDRKLLPHEYQGGSFSVSNLGMFGIREFAAVINPPQSGILAVGAGEKRAVVKDDALAVATVMTCTLSADHRVIDGAIGARLLAAFKAYVEEPLTMLL